jgi:hypothetical protein
MQQANKLAKDKHSSLFWLISDDGKMVYNIATRLNATQEDCKAFSTREE